MCESAPQFSGHGMSRFMIKGNIAFLGGGQMAEALIGGLLASKVSEPQLICATDPMAARRDLLKSRFGILVGEDNARAADGADLVLLAVKPQVLPAVLRDAGSALSGKLVVSIAAGVTSAWIRERVSAARGIVRAMPNTPALVREGVTALAYQPDLAADDVATVRAFFEAVGSVVPVEERLMDAVTGLSGSGPAYVFVAIEALADGGVKWDCRARLRNCWRPRRYSVRHGWFWSGVNIRPRSRIRWPRRVGRPSPGCISWRSEACGAV